MFTHGFLDDQYIWDSLTAQLTTPGIEHVTLDLAGCGDRSQASGPFTYARFADEAGAVVDEIGKPFVIVGHSMGSAVADLVVVGRPDRASAGHRHGQRRASSTGSWPTTPGCPRRRPSPARRSRAPPAPTPPTRLCCAPGPSAGSRRRTRRCSTSPCRSSKPTTSRPAWPRQSMRLRQGCPDPPSTSRAADCHRGASTTVGGASTVRARPDPRLVKAESGMSLLRSSTPPSMSAICSSKGRRRPKLLYPAQRAHWTERLGLLGRPLSSH
ncbi:alpha/beta fold hydrolase [Streptomyces sp. NPDC002573]|uniref:alpha/beta fold hydrolase n=1 Tax=Streptomyces sp. NPDC002573 TaxID=3364651 RepID=UPI0036B56B75